MQTAIDVDLIILCMVGGIDLNTIDAFRTLKHGKGMGTAHVLPDVEVDKACHRLFLAGFSEDETFLLALKVGTGRAGSNICRQNGA
jgi:hypothetical protein